ncbi:hypothetical protein E2C01_087864 [Portunus trituberculatus]|uniref:Uncharacterized protein n=1 Tax=Portunus trituberculatus TaxID=210409 RepID=A0A5B7JIE4_PORTR|nr:hypothetical protein [Portunus trituberculatus]
MLYFIGEHNLDLLDNCPEQTQYCTRCLPD